jgi:hypothetical protein
MFAFNPVKLRDAEKKLKELLLKRQADEDPKNAEQAHDPAVKLQREVEEEVARYLRVSQDEGADPLVWWRQNRKEYPNVGLLARTILAESIVFIHENRRHYAPKVWAVEQKRHKETERRKALLADDPDPSAEN